MQLVDECVHAPYAVAPDSLSGRLERDSVDPARQIDLVPVPADVEIFGRRVIGLCRLPPVAAAARMKADAEAEKLGQPRNCRGDPARFIGREATGRKTPAGLVKVITTVDAGERKTVRIAHDKAICIQPFGAPGRRNVDVHDRMPSHLRALTP